MSTKYLQKPVEETDHFTEFQLRGKTYFCPFGLYGASAYNTILDKQSKKTSKPRTEYFARANTKSPFKALYILKYCIWHLPSPANLNPSEGRKNCTPASRPPALHPGCGGRCCLQWLQLPLLVESQTRGGHQPRSAQHLPTGTHIICVTLKATMERKEIDFNNVLWNIANKPDSEINQERVPQALKGRRHWAEAIGLSLLLVQEQSQASWFSFTGKRVLERLSNFKL